MQNGGYQDRTRVGPRPPIVQGVPGNVRQPVGTEQGRRVVLDGQYDQCREPEQLVGLHEQGGPAAVGDRKVRRIPAAAASPRRTAAGPAGGAGMAAAVARQDAR
jgi:hypothetical protein